MPRKKKTSKKKEPKPIAGTEASNEPTPEVKEVKEAKPVEEKKQKLSPEEVNLPKKALATKRKLDKQEKISFILPLAQDEEEGEEIVCINRYCYRFPKGMRVNLPVDVVKILEEKYDVKSKVGKEKLVTSSNEKLQALT